MLPGARDVPCHSFGLSHSEIQDQMTVTRVQRRLLHELAQRAELNLETLLLESMPTPERSDVFHPAKKTLGSILLQRHILIVAGSN